MQCRMCRNCDWNAQYCLVWNVPLPVIQGNPEYATIYTRCYEPLVVQPQPGPAQAPVQQPQAPAMPAGYSPPVQQQQIPPRPRPTPAMQYQAPPQQQMPPSPTMDDMRMANMFAGADDPTQGGKKKKKFGGGPVSLSGTLGALVNIVVWATLIGLALMFFAIAGYSLTVPQIIIRQGDIPLAAVALLGAGTIISLIKGVTIIRESRNAA